MTPLPTRDEAVGAVASERVLAQFPDSSRSASDSLKLHVLVRGFLVGEIVEIASRLDTQDNFEAEIVVISDHEVLGLKPNLLLPPGRTATSYRNADAGCVLLVLDEVSDLSGMSKVNTVTDGNLLGQRMTDPRMAISCLDTVWGLAGAVGSPPRLLEAAVEDLLSGYGESTTSLALRPWLSFLIAVVGEAAGRLPLDAGHARELLGRHLPELGLFPDSGLVDVSESTPRRRRLRENILFSMDRTNTGRDIDRESLSQVVPSVTFTGLDGNPLPGEENQAVQGLLLGYLEPAGSTSTREIEFVYWRQLFEQKATRRGLGARIEEELLKVENSDALEVYRDLEVRDQLDHRDADAAQQLLDTTDSDDRPIYTWLPDALRRRLEKYANPKAPETEHPLRDLVRVVRDLRLEDPDSQIVVGPREVHGAPVDDGYSKALFGFLFGSVLGGLSRASERFAVAESLLDHGALDDWWKRTIGADSDPDFDSNEHWAPLEIQVGFMSEGATATLRWDPSGHRGWIAFARLCAEPKLHGFERADSDFTEFLAECHEAASLVGGLRNPETEFATRWSILRSDFLAQTWLNGFTIDGAMQYVDRWAALLHEIRVDEVPSGSSTKVVADFLAIDVYQADPDARVMLASHPIRLSWRAKDLAITREHLASAIEGRLRLNSVNDDLFFTRRAQSSPHEQPAVLCDDANVLIAVREEEGHEHFRTIRTRDQTLSDWLAGTDDESLDEMAGSVDEYCSAFPFSEDDLRLLIVVRREGARVVRRILEQIRKSKGPLGVRKDLRVDLHVVAPAAEFESIAIAVEDLDPSSRAKSDFPLTRLTLYEWEDPKSFPSLGGMSSEIHVAIVPNLFAAHARCLETSDREAAFTGRGSFDPKVDPPTSRADGPDSDPSSVAVRLVPAAFDRILGDWSTVNVRQFRGSSVGKDDDGDHVDYFELSVAVGQAGDFFRALHNLAHWVITLDAFMGRRQLESFAHGPEVIKLRSGLGKGGAYTLIVSSQIGREFILDRVARRLEEALGDSLNAPAKQVAGTLYDAARALSPGLLLRATGLGNTSQELLGLIVSQAMVEQFDPPRPSGGSGFSAWISLDEKAEWFGGHHRRRADLLRIDGGFKQDKLHLDVVVVEAKLRDKSALSTAIVQLEETVALLSEAIQSAESLPTDDAEYWRASIAEAIGDSARRTTVKRLPTFRGSIDGEPLSALPDAWRVALKTGSFEVRDIRGAVCTYSPGSASLNEVLNPSGFRWINFEPRELADLLTHLDARDDHTSVGEAEPEIEGGKVDGDCLYTSADLRDLKASGEEEDEESTGASASATRPLGRVQAQPASVAEQGLSEEQLRAQYQKLLDTFSEFGIEVNAVGDRPYRESPSLLVFRVEPGRGVTAGKLNAQSESIKLRLGLPAELNPRGYVDSGAVVFEIPKPLEDRYAVEARALWGQVRDWPRDRLWAPIGENIEGEMVAVDFSSNDSPHLLIGGITGSGKSVAMETILVGLLEHYSPADLQVSAVDPKRVELGFLTGFDHLRGKIGSTSEDAEALLGEAVNEMERRYTLMSEAGINNVAAYNREKPDEKLPWILVVLEEYADLTSSNKREIESHLQRLAQKARASGIHVIVSTQKPTVDVMNSTVRSNLGAQLAFRVRSATDSRVILDEGGAELLGGQGDALLKTVGGKLERFQCAILLD